MEIIESASVSGKGNEKRTVYDVITDRVLALVNETKKLPWEIPWRCEGGLTPMNFITKKPYRGINHIILSLVSFSCPYFATFKQVQMLGGKVRKGAKGLPVVYWHVPGAENEDQEEGKKERAFARYSTVFNLLDTEGIDFEIEGTKSQSEENKIARCEEIILGYAERPQIQFGGGSAFYSPLKDLVAVPFLEAFKSPEVYYSTLFHELGHSTGHSSRLGRDLTPLGDGDKLHRYAEEEIVAEMTASFLAAEAGIERGCEEDSTSYLLNWIQRIKADKKLIIRAASAAQKATDYILQKGG